MGGGLGGLWQFSRGTVPSGVVFLPIRIGPFVPKNEVGQKRVDWFFFFKGPKLSTNR